MPNEFSPPGTTFKVCWRDTVTGKQGRIIGSYAREQSNRVCYEFQKMYKNRKYWTEPVLPRYTKSTH